MTYNNQQFQQQAGTFAPQHNSYAPQQPQQERELGWDDTILDDGNEFVLLPTGDYDFTVEKFERGRSKGLGSLPASNMAIITLKIDSPEGTAFIKENLILHTKMEWKLSQFFACLGLKKKGEPLRMNWQLVQGARGKVKIKIEEFESSKTGNMLQSNKVDKFIMPPEYDTQQPVQQQPLPPQGGGFTPGSF